MPQGSCPVAASQLPSLLSPSYLCLSTSLSDAHLPTSNRYKAYIGMLRLEHRYNNPIFLGACGLVSSASPPPFGHLLCVIHTLPASLLPLPTALLCMPLRC